MNIDATANWLVWDNTEAVTYTSHRTTTASAGDAVLANVTAKRRNPSDRELAVSQGVYTSQDLVWLVPQANLTGLTPGGDKEPVAKPADTITDAAGNVWTVLEVFFNTLKSTWRLMTRNLAIAFDLQDAVDIQRYTLTYDAAGAPVRAWPDNNVGTILAAGSTPYAALPARAQLLTDEIKDERGLRGFQGNYAVYLSQQVQVTQEDRVKWTDKSTSPATVRYLDILGIHNPLRIDELPVLDARLAP